MNQRNKWDHMTEANKIEKLIKKIIQVEMAKAVRAIRLGKTLGPF